MVGMKRGVLGGSSSIWIGVLCCICIPQVCFAAGRCMDAARRRWSGGGVQNPSGHEGVMLVGLIRVAGFLVELYQENTQSNSTQKYPFIEPYLFFPYISAVSVSCISSEKK